MTAHFYTLQLSVCDANKSGAIIHVKMQYISVSQIYLIIEVLQTMLESFKHTSTPYYTIIADTVNTLNNIMSEVEHNTVFCTLCPNLQANDAEIVADSFISSLDERTLDASIDIEAAESSLTSTVLRPFLYKLRDRDVFSYGVQSTTSPNWIHVLRDLDILSV